MKNLRSRKYKPTLSLQLLKLKYQQARNNKIQAVDLTGIHKTNDVKNWIADIKKRGWVTVRSDKLILRY